MTDPNDIAAFHSKVCEQKDDLSRRLHMALAEVGFPCRIIDARFSSCKRTHIGVAWELRDRNDPRLIKAVRLVYGELADEWFDARELALALAR